MSGISSSPLFSLDLNFRRPTIYVRLCTEECGGRLSRALPESSAKDRDLRIENVLYFTRIVIAVLCVTASSHFRTMCN